MAAPNLPWARGSSNPKDSKVGLLELEPLSTPMSAIRDRRFDSFTIGTLDLPIRTSSKKLDRGADRLQRGLSSKIAAKDHATAVNVPSIDPFDDRIGPRVAEGERSRPARIEDEAKDVASRRSVADPGCSHRNEEAWIHVIDDRVWGIHGTSRETASLVLSGASWRYIASA